jgi:hypothetical protein
MQYPKANMQTYAFSGAQTTVEPRLETHWTRVLHVDIHDGPRPRALRRIGITIAACLVVIAASLMAVLEAKALAQVVSPEAAAAAAVACWVAPPKPNHA